LDEERVGQEPSGTRAQWNGSPVEREPSGKGVQWKGSPVERESSGTRAKRKLH
ncbi:hypothetical protein BgiBS90_003656, partial [Biomphalaria glabrata]